MEVSCLCSGKEAGTFWIRSWMGPRPVLDTSEKTQITNLCRTVPPLVQWLLR